MKRLLFLIYISVCAVAISLPARAQTPHPATKAAPADSAAESQRDSVVISLLTCSPGSLVYELYGHTALRVRTLSTGADWVFNYGTFSFRRPHFIWRFILGETDYELSVSPYAFFYEAYMREGRGIQEQRLNLTPEEERKLVDALSENLQPEKATYRYNFFYDNCTTRAIDMISQAVDGKITWPAAHPNTTFRGVVRKFAEKSPWNRFGQDLLLGAEADRPTTQRQQMFAPLYARDFLAEAVVTAPDGSRRKLASPAINLLPPAPAPDDAIPLTPLWTFGILLAFTVVLTLYEWKRKRYFWPYDVLLFIAQGAAGCIITLLFFASTHPTVGSNWLITFLNPLPLLWFPWFMKRAWAGRRSRAIYLQAAFCIVAFGACATGLQSYPPEALLILCTLALRCVAHITQTRRRRPQGSHQPSPISAQ